MKNKSPLSMVLVSGALVVSACAPKNFKALESVATDTTGAIGCSDFESKSWDAVNKYLIEQQSMPTSEELHEHVRTAIKSIKSSSKNSEKLNTLAADVEGLYDVLLTEAPRLEKVTDAQGLLTVLSALELGDHTTDSKVQLQEKVQTQFAKIKMKAAQLGVECGMPTEDASGNKDNESATAVPEKINTSLSLPVYGTRFTMANAYQSCQALTEDIMSARTADISSSAIRISGTHSDGVGKKREIASLTALLRSHPYYKNVNSYASGCLNGSSYPMIYDYGGKPYATTSSTSDLNLFKNAGSGTSVLGIDCSGFIYTGLATAGLRVSPGKVMKATGVSGISASMYIEPQKNGLSCLAKITVSPKSDIRAGDIVAVPGHVLMVDGVGSDPFGLNSVKTTADCDKVSYKNFDFAVIQSSPSKNATGINRYQADDYLAETEKMRNTLEKYAYYACLARVNNKSYTPNLGTGSVVRHSLTSECMGTRIKLTQESCVQSCSQLVR